MATSTSTISLPPFSSPFFPQLSQSNCRFSIRIPCNRNANGRIRSPAVRAGVTAAPPTPAAPPTSSKGIVLVDKSEAEKPDRLKSSYLEKVVPLLKEEFGHKNIHEVPKIEKIVVNCGMGDAEQNSKGLEAAMRDLALITGQRPVKTKAKNSIASFKLREGTVVGIAVTLRGNVMYAFLDRLINLGLPRTRDFQGVNPNSFDGHGNFSIGMKDQSVFPEIRYEVLGKQRGMDVCITTTAKTDNEAQRLLALMGMPFREGGGSTVLVRTKKRKAAHFDSRGRSILVGFGTKSGINPRILLGRCFLETSVQVCYTGHNMNVSMIGHLLLSVPGSQEDLEHGAHVFGWLLIVCFKLKTWLLLYGMLLLKAVLLLLAGPLLLLRGLFVAQIFCSPVGGDAAEGLIKATFSLMEFMGNKWSYECKAHSVSILSEKLILWQPPECRSKVEQ